MGSGNRSARDGHWTIATMALAAVLMASAYAGLQQQDRPPAVAEAPRR